MKKPSCACVCMIGFGSREIMLWHFPFCLEYWGSTSPYLYSFQFIDGQHVVEAPSKGEVWDADRVSWFDGGHTPYEYAL